MHNSNLRGGPALNPCVVVQLSDATKFKDLDEAHEVSRCTDFGNHYIFSCKCQIINLYFVGGNRTS